MAYHSQPNKISLPQKLTSKHNRAARPDVPCIFHVGKEVLFGEMVFFREELFAGVGPGIVTSAKNR